MLVVGFPDIFEYAFDWYYLSLIWLSEISDHLHHLHSVLSFHQLHLHRCHECNTPVGLVYSTHGYILIRNPVYHLPNKMYIGQR